MAKIKTKLATAVSIMILLIAVATFPILNTAMAGFQVDSRTLEPHVKINPGELTLDMFGPPVATLSDTTLTGYPVTALGSLGMFRVTNARGSDVGWRLHMLAPDFTHDTTPSYPPIPTDGKFQVTWPGYWNGSGSGGVTSSPGNLGGAGLNILDTDAGDPDGMGISWVGPSVSLEIPGSAYAGRYTTTVTATLYSY